jgi:hypothetical protein
MLSPSFIVIDFSKYDNLPKVQLPENAYISYKISTASIHLIDFFYRKLFSSPEKYPFCLLISLENELNKPAGGFDSLVDFLVAFSFHFRYIKVNYDSPLILFEIDKEETNEYISIIKEALKGHGYNDIETVVIYKNNISPTERKKNIRFDLHDNIDGLLCEYISSIKKLNSSDSSFFFFLDKPENLPEILDRIQKAETIIREDLPQTYYLLKENISLRAEEQELLLKIELLGEQLNSLNNYHLYYNSSDTRYKRQITELLKFYKSEYEILPLWYKRFGHILKVIMGKRTFRSLFNDNVKKYKS